MADDDLRFGVFAIDRARRLAVYAGTHLHLTPKAFDLLVLLARRPDRDISKAELKDALWPGLRVEESNLTQTVFMLRKALRDAGCETEMIATVPRVGYRFVPPAASAGRMSSPSRRPNSCATSPPAYRMWFAAAGLAVLMVAALAVLALTPGQRHVDSVAIVPFESDLGVGEQFVTDGIVDQMARELARATSVRLAPRSDREPTAPGAVAALAQALRVDALLTGRVHAEGADLVVASELRDARSHQVLWRSEQRGPMSALGGHNGAAARLTADLFAHVWPEVARPEVREREAAAHLAFLKGRAHLARRTPEALQDAIAAFRDAVARDGTFAEAYAGLAEGYAVMGVVGALARDTAYPTAKEFALKALSLDERLAEAHSSLGLVLQVGDRKWADAELRYQRAIELDPSCVQAHHWYALLLDSLVRPAESRREIDAALALAPLSASVNADKGLILAHQRRFDEAVTQFQRTLAIDPTCADAVLGMGWAYARGGRYDEALVTFAKAEPLGIDHAHVVSGIGYTHARAGHSARARAALAEIERMDLPDLGQKQVLLAQVLIGLGETDEAMRRLLAGLPDGEPTAKVAYWELRQHPGYDELLRRSGY